MTPQQLPAAVRLHLVSAAQALLWLGAVFVVAWLLQSATPRSAGAAGFGLQLAQSEDESAEEEAEASKSQAPPAKSKSGTAAKRQQRQDRKATKPAAASTSKSRSQRDDTDQDDGEADDGGAKRKAAERAKSVARKRPKPLPAAVPLPPQRPQAKPPAAAPGADSAPEEQQPAEQSDEGETPAAEKSKAPAVDARVACAKRLQAAGVDAEPAATPDGVKAACTIDVPVRLKSVAVKARSGQVVRFPAQPLMSCSLAEALAAWTSDLAAPLLAGTLRSELVSIDTGPGFECRNRNRAKVGKLSAHANGLAIDVASFRMANSVTIRVGSTESGPSAAAFNGLRKGACGWFTTILGPGSDEAHSEHLHLDIIRHGASDRYRMCQ